MEIEGVVHQADDPIAIMHVKGAINASNFIQVSNKAQELYTKPARNLIIDLTDVTNISTTGLAAIHKVALVYSGVPQRVQQDANPDFTHSSQARKHVRLLNPPEVEKTIEQAGLKPFFKIFHDLDIAIATFKE